MNGYLLKARKNLDFLNILENEFPSEFFDWKVTIIFYTTLHFTKGYLKAMGITPGTNHFDIQLQLDGYSGNTVGTSIVDLLYPKEYFRIREYSELSRYDPISNDGLYDSIWKDYYSKSKAKMQRLISYIGTRGITF